VAELLKCACGQALDISEYTAGQQVRCPTCQQVLTVPAATATAQPTVAVAMAVANESDDALPAARQQPRTGDPLARRRMVERKSAGAAQEGLKKFMIWPCLVLGLASLAVGVFGVTLLFTPKTIELKISKDPVSGVEITHMYANAPKDPDPNADPNAPQPITYERVEVQPDIYPGDATDGDTFTLNGESPQLRNGAWLITHEGKQLAVERRGYWFYEVDLAAAPVETAAPQATPDAEAVRNETMATPDESAPTRAERRLIRKVDLPLVAMTRPNSETYIYKRVQWKDDGFVDPVTGKPVPGVCYYRVNEQTGLQEQLIKGDFEKREVSPLAKLASPMVFIISGPLVGLLLLAGAAFFAWEVYFSPAAKERARRNAAMAGAAS